MLVIPDDHTKPFTDYTRWRLKADDGGRHIWHYLQTDQECKAWPMTAYDKYWLGLPTGNPNLPPAKDPISAARNGFKFYKTLQCEDGHWTGEYGGPMFLIPGYVIGSYVSGMPFAKVERLEIIRYLINRAHPEDGGWGIHIESQSSVFGTALNYVAMRLLGCPADHPVLVKARGTLHKLGGAAAAPAWGKFWLSVLNVYEWEGNNPVPPEVWLFPESLPFHPHRWWTHVRTVYIPMSYLYGIKFKAPENDLILSLREEIYTEKYDDIDWPAQRNNICEADIYIRHSRALDALNVFVNAYECCHLPPLRRRALEYVYSLVCREDENTSYQTLGPVGKMFALVVRAHVEGPDSHAYKMHQLKRKDFMWMCPEGMLMCGTNGSQLWDIAFVTQAIVEAGIASDEENKDSMLRALDWLDKCQIQNNPIHHESVYRHASKGAWPFSTREQSYTVSDCTGEGLKSVIYLQEHLKYMPRLVSDSRLCDAVDVMLSLQNADGGFASYELIRGPKWNELLNPADVFGDIMIEYSYVECTTSVLTALSIFKKYNPKYRRDDIERTTKSAVQYIKKKQLPHGGWVGSWGICFTYAAQFSLESLSLVGETYANSETVQRACDFLVSKQKEDGGWGESYKSCELSQYIQHEKSQVVQTSWATLGLIYGKYPHREPIERAVRLVMSRQLSDGSWAQEAIEGVFNKNCAISYPNFKFSFTIWMLGKAHQYLQTLKA